jgi:hypothetical protein
LVTPIEVNLKDATSINLASCALSCDFSRVDNVLKDGILNSGEGTRARAKSLGLLGSSVALSKDVTLCNNDKVLSRKFLLQLTNEAGLDLLEGLLKLVRNVDNSSLTPCSTVNFFGSEDEKITERGLELGRGELKVKKLLCDLGLELIRFLDQQHNTKYTQW